MDFDLTKRKTESVLRKNIESGRIFYFLPAIYLVILLISKGLVHPSGYYRLHYLFTYDHGFLSRGLVGEVMSWFFDTITDRTIQYVVLGCSILLAVAASLCFGRALSKLKVNTEKFNFAFMLTAVILIMPTSFSLQFESVALDKFIWAATVLAVFLSDFKIGVWFVPLLCVVSTLINPIYVFGSMILIAIVLLQKFYSEGFSFKMGLICFLSYAGIIITILLSVGSTHSTGFADTNEMLDFYYQRFVGEPLSAAERELFEDEWLFEYFVSAEEVLRRTFGYYFKEWGFGITVITYSLLIILPFTVLLSYIWIKAIKNSEKKFQKFIYVLCLIAPLLVVPETIIGWEIPRYFSDSLIVQLSLMLFFIANKNEGIMEALDCVVQYFKQHRIMLLIAVLHFSLWIVL